MVLRINSSKLRQVHGYWRDRFGNDATNVYLELCLREQADPQAQQQWLDQATPIEIMAWLILRLKPDHGDRRNGW